MMSKMFRRCHVRPRRPARILAALVGLALVGLAAPASAQTTGSDAAGTAAAAPAAPPPPAAPASSEARQACAAAMNADPQFAAEIVKVADEKAAQKRDTDTVAAHVDAEAHIQKNERHVIYAYAAMWIVSAAFVLYLWRRQQALVGEISQLRRDLEAAAEAQPAEQRS